MNSFSSTKTSMMTATPSPLSSSHGSRSSLLRPWIAGILCLSLVFFMVAISTSLRLSSTIASYEKNAGDMKKKAVEQLSKESRLRWGGNLTVDGRIRCDDLEMGGPITVLSSKPLLCEKGITVGTTAKCGDLGFIDDSSSSSSSSPHRIVYGWDASGQTSGTISFPEHLFMEPPNVFAQIPDGRTDSTPIIYHIAIADVTAKGFRYYKYYTVMQPEGKKMPWNTAESEPFFWMAVGNVV